MKDLSILPEPLRDAALVAGGDFGWPLELAAEVVQTLADAGAVVTGVEAWSVDEEGVPASVGWSSYDLDDYAADWKASVETARVEPSSLRSRMFRRRAWYSVQFEVEVSSR